VALRLEDLDWAGVLQGPFHPSPSSWADQVLYFMLVDRFSDGREDGYRDVAGNVVPGATPPFRPADEGRGGGRRARPGSAARSRGHGASSAISNGSV
jgi:hypothetical protein